MRLADGGRRHGRPASRYSIRLSATSSQAIRGELAIGRPSPILGRVRPILTSRAVLGQRLHGPPPHKSCFFSAGTPRLMPGPAVSERTTPKSCAAAPSWGAGRGSAPSDILLTAPDPSGAVERTIENFVAGPRFENRALGTGPILARMHGIGNIISLQSLNCAPPPRPPPMDGRTGWGLRVAHGVAPPTMAVPADALPSGGHRTEITCAEGAGAAAPAPFRHTCRLGTEVHAALRRSKSQGREKATLRLFG